MKINSEEKLINILDNDLAWRKKELSYTKALVLSSKSKNQEYTIRSGILVLYAHWEGFIKNSSRWYINYLRNQKLKYCELSDNLVTLSLKSSFVECGNTKKTRVHFKIVNILLNGMASLSTIPSDKEAIATNSNLNFETFLEIVFSIGLDHKDFELKENYLDEGLIKTRNEIAHGEYEIPDVVDYLDWHDTIIEIIDSFQDKISDAIINKRYLK